MSHNKVIIIFHMNIMMFTRDAFPFPKEYMFLTPFVQPSSEMTIHLFFHRTSEQWPSLGNYTLFER
jgi:hypothetical protein